MKKVFLINSLKDLAAFKAKILCSEDKPYYQQFIEVYEKKIIDDLIQNAIDSENLSRVSPIIQEFAEKNSEIPFPFEVNGALVNQIRLEGETYKHCEVSFNGDLWRYMDGDDKLRLYHALEKAGLLNDPE